MSSSRTRGKPKKPHGQARQSQVVTTFGPGSLFDLPNHSVIVGGLEYWTKGEEIPEPRLEAKLKELLQVPSLALHAAPPDTEDPTSTQKTGITCWQFPGWFITQGGARDRGRASNALPPPHSTQRSLQGQVHRRRPQAPAGCPGTLRESVQKRAYRGHRLVLLRA
ncbi:MAG: hypothetical protein ACYC3I_10835 [Gemmataceae bacterium]